MGKKAFQIKFDKNTMKNIGQNIRGTIDPLGIFNQKKGGGGGGGPTGPAQPDLTAKFMQAQEEQRLKNLETSGQLTEQLRQQAMGEGPLAGAQLKQAQSRNLAQTLAAAQSAGGSPLSTRQMLQQRGQQGQELAQLGLQERLGAQQALGGQIAQQAGMSRADIESAYGIGMTPVKMQHEAQMQQARIQAEKDAALKQQQAGILGGVLQGGTSLALASDENQKMAPQKSKYSKGEEKKSDDDSDEKESNLNKAMKSVDAPKNIGEAIANMGKMGAGYIKDRKAAAPPSPSGGGLMSKLGQFLSSDEQQKTTISQKNEGKLPSAHAEVNEFLDKLEAKKYQYKNPEIPGAAPGTRYGIVAQDLEKSSLGKTLVKEGQHGKVVDTVQGFGAVLAAQAELNRRLKKLEKKGK